MFVSLQFFANFKAKTIDFAAISILYRAKPYFCFHLHINSSVLGVLVKTWKQTCPCIETYRFSAHITVP